MLMTIGLILLVCWALGVFAFHVTTGVIHVLIALAIIAIVMHLVRGIAASRRSSFVSTGGSA